MNVALVNVTYALFLAFLTEVLVEHFIGKPQEQKAPLLDRWWLIYAALIVGGIICWFAGLNIFGTLMPDMLGRILTCLIVGGGSELLHSIVNWDGRTGEPSIVLLPVMLHHRRAPGDEPVVLHL